MDKVMCGRFEVNKKQIDQAVYQSFKIDFQALHNLDQRPSQEVACIHYTHSKFEQINCHWGIKPNWAHYPIINAQMETVATKKTFSSAFALHRCLIPMTAWFEWTGERGHKTKHRFSRKDKAPLWMAGILIPDKVRHFQLVSLTKESDTTCQAYHHRMPLLIDTDYALRWLSLPPSLNEMLEFESNAEIEVFPKHISTLIEDTNTGLF